ncbi:TolC family protein [Candidatus Zixiibacteriota bacterium]
MCKKRSCLMFLLASFLITLFAPLSFGQLPVVNIGIIGDGPWEKNDAFRELIQREILELTGGEFEVRFPEDKRIVADWSVKGIRKAGDRLLADPEVDMIIALGVITSNDFCHRGDLPKPVIAPAVLDIELQAVPLKEGASGVENLNYVTYPATMRSDIKAFLSIVPFEKLAILTNQSYHEAIPELAGKTAIVLGEMGIEPVRVPVGKSIDETLANFPADAEAVYIAPLIHLPPGEFDRLIAALIERKLPSFSLFGKIDVERGILAGLKPNIFPTLARRVALNVQRILLGEPAGSIPVTFSVRDQLFINMATARAIGISPSWAVRTEAEVIGTERKEIARQLDLFKTVQEALTANLDLASEERFVAAGKQNVRGAWGNLLPQVNVAGTGLLIDEDRAAASFGQQPEKTLTGSITARQIIFSEPAWANLSIQKSIQKTREEGLQELRLDIVQAAATAYLNVLKAKTYEKIQKENLKRTRSNLEMAQIREVVGTAGPAEVYRWESEIATNRKTVIEANSQRNLAEIDLNRLLHRPAEEHFTTKDADFQASGLPSAEERLIKYLGDQESFRLFRAFAVEESFRNSPELASLDAAIKAQERVLGSASNSFWSPTLALQGEVKNLFSKDGAGSEIDTGADETDWSVALNLSFPLFEGGSKFAARNEAVQELARLRLQRQAVAELIEQRVRSELHLLGASYAGIHQARLAAEAAGKSLNVVEDAYSRGVVSIVDLLDAQNAALVTDLAAANAVYDFLINLMAFERAAGEFAFFMSKENQESLIQRVNDYFDKEGNLSDEQ